MNETIKQQEAIYTPEQTFENFYPQVKYQIAGILQNFPPRTESIPSEVVAINMHYYFWPSSVPLDAFRIDDTSTWGSTEQEKGLVTEQLERIVASVVLGNQLRQRGYTIRYVNAAATMTWESQANPTIVVDKVVSEISRLLPSEFIHVDHLTSALTTAEEIEGTIGQISRFVELDSFGSHPAHLAGIVSVTSGYHAKRTAASYSFATSRSDFNYLQSQGTKILVLGNPVIRNGTRIERLSEFTQDVNVPAQLVSLLELTAIDSAHEAAQLLREEKIASLPPQLLELIAHVTRSEQKAQVMNLISGLIQKVTVQEDIKKTNN